MTIVEKHEKLVNNFSPSENQKGLLSFASSVFINGVFIDNRGYVGMFNLEYSIETLTAKVEKVFDMLLEGYQPSSIWKAFEDKRKALGKQNGGTHFAQLYQQFPELKKETEMMVKKLIGLTW